MGRARATFYGVAAAGMLAGGPALCGPWAREAGDAFVSLRLAAEQSPVALMAGLWQPETHLAFYGEVGLGRGLTLGADAGGSATIRQVVAFLRYSPRDPDAVWQVAVDAGLGGRQEGDAEARAVLRLGASVGRGFGAGGGDAWYMPVAHQGGWAVLDAVALLEPETGDALWQVEATAGLRLSGRLAGTFSLKAEEWPGADLLVTASPSVILEVAPGTSIRLGAQAALEGGDNLGLSLSLWREF